MTLTEDTKTSQDEAAAVRMMPELGIPAQEVADWTMAARRRREAAENIDKRAKR